MVANVRGYTDNYNFKLINFDTPRWHTLEYANWSMLDTLLVQAGVVPIRGAWLNSTHYFVGDRVYDEQTGDMYRALVDHTSATTGSFLNDRGNNPTYWTIQTIGVPIFRFDWLPGVAYSLGDIVVVNDYAYHLCTNSHISSPVFGSDAIYWVLVFDATDAVQTATDAATAADLSAEAAAISAVNAGNSETAAAASAVTAVDASVAASASALAAFTSETNASTSETNAAASAVEAASQAAGLRGTSLTSNAISVGAKSFVTQADKQFNVGNFMTIVSTANPTLNGMTGVITSYSGTALAVDITGIFGSGTIADWQLYISGARGVPGVDGSGGGGIPDAPLDGALYGRVNATWLKGVKLGGDVMTGDLTISKADPRLHIVAGVVQEAAIHGWKGATQRWKIVLGNSVAETGGAVGSDFSINSRNDDGTGRATPLSISRETGLATVAADPTAPLGIATKQSSEAAAAAAALNKVSKAGDTMTGPLFINSTINNGFNLKDPTGLVFHAIAYYSAVDTASLVFGTLTNHPVYFYCNNVAAAFIHPITGVFNFNYSPTAPTPALNDDSSKLATTNFVQHAARYFAAKGANYTFIAGDAGGVIAQWVATPITFTIPPNSSVPFAVGTQIDLMMIDVGQITVAPGAGVSLISEDNKRKLAKQGSTATLFKVSTDLWVLSGSLVA